MRHLISGIDWAMAGAATAVEAARPTPADFRNSRRFISVSPALSRLFADATATLELSFLIDRPPTSDWRNLTRLSADAKRKNPGRGGPGSRVSRPQRCDQVRVRV